jgi:hypothetical protein
VMAQVLMLTMIMLWDTENLKKNAISLSKVLSMNLGGVLVTKRKDSSVNGKVMSNWDGQCNRDLEFYCVNYFYLGPDCPDGYSSIGQLSDGRTCHGTPSSSTDDFDTATCASDLDLQRKRWTPTSPYIMDRFRLEYA